MKPISKRQALEKEMDALVKAILLLRTGCRSMKSGRYLPGGKGMHPAHFITRSNKRVKWDLNNVFLLTAGEHKWWAHKYTEQYRDWVKDRLGEEEFQNLLIRARARGPIRIGDLKVVRLYLLDLYEKEKRKILPTESDVENFSFE